MLRRPQCSDQAAGGVADQQQLVVVLRDQVRGRVELEGVVVQVGDETAEVAAA